MQQGKPQMSPPEVGSCPNAVPEPAFGEPVPLEFDGVSPSPCRGADNKVVPLEFDGVSPSPCRGADNKVVPLEFDGVSPSPCRGADNKVKFHPTTSTGTPKWPREVGLGIKMEKILSIDTAHSRFSAIIKVSYEWQLTEEEYSSWRDHSTSKLWRPSWEPNLGLPNVEKVELKEELLVPNKANLAVFDIFEHVGKVFTIIYIRYRCVFSEVYELKNFPFDCQDLTIMIQAQDAGKVVLRPRFKRADFASVDCEHFTLAEWVLHPPVANFEAGLSSKGRSGLSTSSQFFFLLKLQRRHQFYVGRFFFLAGMLTFGSLLSWSIDKELPSRIAVCFTILLTLIAFQMAMSSKLPQISYFTLLDIYLVLSQRFIFLVAMQHAVLKVFGDTTVDVCLFGCSAAAYVLLQVSFIFFVRKRSQREKERLTLCAWEVDEWLTEEGFGNTQAPSFKLHSGQGETMESVEAIRTKYRTREPV